jgi:hypothetical protein
VSDLVRSRTTGASAPEGPCNAPASVGPYRLGTTKTLRGLEVFPISETNLPEAFSGVIDRR